MDAGSNSEHELYADDDDMSDRLSGTLSFTDHTTADDSSPPAADHVPSSSQHLTTTTVKPLSNHHSKVTSEVPHLRHGDHHDHVEGLFTQCKVIFKISSAKTIKIDKDKYVAYTVVLKMTPGIDKTPATIVRRFTDFYHLNEKLRELYPVEMRNVNFPKKTVIGNFKPSTIGQRSLSFENYLQYLHSIIAIRQSREFLDFLTLPELRAACALVRARQYDSAIQPFLNLLHLFQKVPCVERLVEVLCSLVVCHYKCDDVAKSCEYAEQAAANVSPDSPLYVPLLQRAIHLYWNVGKDKQHLEFALERAVVSCEPDGSPRHRTAVLPTGQTDLHGCVDQLYL